MKLKINREYLHRHLFVTVLMACLGCWFGYDGLVRYPSTPAADLYRSIELADPPQDLDLEAFKRQKTQTQHGFALIALAAALVVGLRLARAARFRFEFDGEGFSCGGRRYAYPDIAETDRSRWETKSILALNMKSGERIVLDAWHHVGVKEFEAGLQTAQPKSGVEK